MLALIQRILQYLLENWVQLAICIALAAIFFTAMIALICISTKAKKKAKAAAKAEIAPAEVCAAPAAETERFDEGTSTVEESPAIEESPKAEDDSTPAVAETPVPNAEKEPATIIEEAPIPVQKKSTAKKAAPNAAKSALAATKKMGEAPQEKAVATPAVKAQKVELSAKPIKPAPVEPENASAKKATSAKKAPAEKGARYTGKWVVCKLILTDSNDQPIDETYFFELRASNGELLLASEEYTSQAGALKGIQTHKDNVEKGNFRITVSKKGDYIFKLLTAKNTLLCTGANYKSLERCESAVASTKRFAATAVLQEETEEVRVKQSADDDSPAPEIPDNGYTGKWIISSKGNDAVGTMYYFELFASNGEKLLTSEEYTTYEGAVNAVDTHKTNIAKGNFRISVTKRGDYIFKLLGGNGQLLCLGEHYKTRSRCESAVDSVKRFSASAPVLKYGEIKSV